MRRGSAHAQRRRPARSWESRGGPPAPPPPCVQSFPSARPRPASLSGSSSLGRRCLFLLRGLCSSPVASMAPRRRGAGLRLCATVFLLDMAFCKGFVEDLDESFKDNRKDDIWLVDFYAPWCGHCKKLEPIWNEVGLEMKSIGSPVKVGKMDATSYSSIASEFGVRGYPTIKLLKGDLAYNYRGPRTKDDIIEFAHRVSGALIRPLPSQQMFEHVQKRHRVFFVYIGGESPLKEKYIDAASELIVYTYFFSASEDVVPEYVILKEMPAVLVFKDETYFVYDEYEDGDLSSWINRERFQNYLTMDGFLLYELGDTGKLVAIAVIDEKNTSNEHTRLKSIIQEVARDYRDQFHRDFQFGHMDGNDYINTLLMDELKVPTVVVLNTSNQQYFLLDRQIGSAEDMAHFIRDILDGTVPSIFKSSPLMGCFLFGLPLGVISIMCYGIYTADTDGGYIEERYEVSRSEIESQEPVEESKEQEPSDGATLGPTVQEPKDVLEKKKD
ncbi:protein disulfide-isomerase TMX3 isoform X2 [Prionailurus bengalensis]|uniref:protein disulfide-isomerase TMX3 isoform X2 n=1 Tax=Prionailurus bengalensis TaxID=37029 RepID=UPI001CA986CB|nr:protein disulfide-isomerase TMX3 isoform X2 [Prionailurus bengalensis]